MAATPIPTNYVAGNKPTAAQLNAYGRFMSALMGGAPVNDNDGDPILPVSMNMAAPLRLGADAEQALAIDGPRTYRVLDGKWLIVRDYIHGDTASPDSITPKGGVAHVLATAVGTRIRCGRRIVLGPGDKITMALSSRCAGVLLALPSGLTPICTVVTNAGPYEVAAGRRLLLLEALPETTSSVTLQVDGGAAFEAIPMGFDPVSTITGISVANPTVVTTLLAHGLQSGEQVHCLSTNSTPVIDGPRIVTVTGATTFTVPVNVTGAGNSGTVRPLADKHTRMGSLLLTEGQTVGSASASPILISGVLLRV